MKTYSPMDDTFRDSIGTVDQDGKRRFIHPKKVTGYWVRARTWVAMGLLVFMFVVPWIRIDGQPFLKLDVLGREFVILGTIFWPQDSYLLVMAMISGVLFVVLFTVVYGRIFCGWMCPQTIFMEHVFRKIEYWIDGDRGQQIRLRKLPWNSREKLLKRSAKYTLFYIISFAISNTFLMVIIGSDEWLKLVNEGPAAHVGNFTSILVFSAVFFAVFAWFREQVCIMVCPYGRLQGAMIDRKTVVIAYDKIRGEARAKFKKKENREEAGKGDCIDCNQCVDVCPTGIDIRNGTQLECINCTACIDACNTVMEKVDLPKGLIRFASEEEIVSGEKWKFTTRAKAYTAVLGILLITMGFLLSERPAADVTLLRAPGQTYDVLKETQQVQNVVSYTIVNKTNTAIKVELKAVQDFAQVELGSLKTDSISQGDLKNGIIIIRLPKDKINRGERILEFEVLVNNEVIGTEEFQFIGPY